MLAYIINLVFYVPPVVILTILAPYSYYIFDTDDTPYICPMLYVNTE